jgi:hypothetical protein
MAPSAQTQDQAVRPITLRREGGMLDLRALHLGSFDIASFARKAEALAFAKAHGWYATSVTRAFNRFNVFWIVWDPAVSPVRIATRSGRPAEFPVAQAA